MSKVSFIMFDDHGSAHMLMSTPMAYMPRIGEVISFEDLNKDGNKLIRKECVELVLSYAKDGEENVDFDVESVTHFINCASGEVTYEVVLATPSR